MRFGMICNWFMQKLIEFKYSRHREGCEIYMVGEITFNDAAQMLVARNAAAQAVARQNTSILNICDYAF
jgi:hypothetical protein